MSCNWPIRKLGDLVRFNSGGTPSKKNEAYWGGDIPWISASSMNSTRYTDSDLKVTAEGSQNGTRLVPKDTVLLLVRGGALHNKIPVGITTKEVTFNQDVKAVVPKTTEITSWYLLFWFVSMKKTLLAKVENTGIGAGKLDTKILQELEIPLPPLAELKRLEAFCKALDDKLILNRETNKTLEEMAQAIFTSWFVDFDPIKAKMNGEQPEGMDAATASLFPEKLVESEEGLIPEGWSVEPLRNVSRVINGRAYKNTEFKDEGTPIIRIQNLTGKGKTVYSDMELPKDKLAEHGDLIFAWSATFGPHLWRGPKSIYHYHIWKMDVDETKFGKYLLYLHLARLTDYLKNQGTGSIFTHLTKAIMESQKLVVPSESIVEAFSKVVTPLFAQIDSLHKENKVLEQLRDTLLPKLLSGEIELETK